VEEAFGWTALSMFNYMVRTRDAAQPPRCKSAPSRARPARQTPLAGFADEEADTTRDLHIKGAKRAHVALARVG
jgi:hypothetical protein